MSGPNEPWMKASMLSMWVCACTSLLPSARFVLLILRRHSSSSCCASIFSSRTLPNLDGPYGTQADIRCRSVAARSTLHLQDCRNWHGRQRLSVFLHHTLITHPSLVG
jgi:hypothetical protein